MVDGQKFERRPVVLEVDAWGEDGEPKRHRIVVPNMIASTFKVTNGKFSALFTIDELGVELKAFDRDGNEERFVSKKLKI